MVLTGGVGGPGAPPAPGKSPLISPGGGTLLAPPVTFPFSNLVSALPPTTTTRPAAPGTYTPFPGPLIYWPYPSPPISPTNYFNTLPGSILPPHVNVNGMSTPSLLTPTSSISSLSNGVTSPVPGAVPPVGTQPSTLLTVENVNLHHRGIEQRTPTGEGVVTFPGLVQADRSLSDKNRHNLGQHRYIELFPV